MKQQTKYIIAAILAILALLLLFGNDTEEMPNVAEGVNFEPKNEALEEWVEELGDMENCSPQGTWDSGSYSYGRWCYKKSTFEYFVRNYFGYDLLPYVEDEELGNWIGDEAFQRKLTRMEFEKSYANTSHWHTSIYIRGLGEPPKVVIITEAT